MFKVGAHAHSSHHPDLCLPCGVRVAQHVEGGDVAQQLRVQARTIPQEPATIPLCPPTCAVHRTCGSTLTTCVWEAVGGCATTKVGDHAHSSQLPNPSLPCGEQVAQHTEKAEDAQQLLAITWVPASPERYSTTPSQRDSHGLKKQSGESNVGSMCAAERGCEVVPGEPGVAHHGVQVPVQRDDVLPHPRLGPCDLCDHCVCYEEQHPHPLPQVQCTAEGVDWSTEID